MAGLSYWSQLSSGHMCFESIGTRESRYCGICCHIKFRHYEQILASIFEYESYHRQTFILLSKWAIPKKPPLQYLPSTFFCHDRVPMSCVLTRDFVRRWTWVMGAAEREWLLMWVPPFRDRSHLVVHDRTLFPAWEVFEALCKLILARRSCFSQQPFSACGFDIKG